MSLQIAAVANSIAALSVSGVVIKDIDEVPQVIDSRTVTLAPLTAYITNFVMERDSFGGGSSAKMTVTYTLNYRLYHSPVGDGRTNIFSGFADLVAKVSAVWDAVLAIDVFVGAIDIIPVGVSQPGYVDAPDGSLWIGCDLSFRVAEFVN